MTKVGLKAADTPKRKPRQRSGRKKVQAALAKEPRLVTQQFTREENNVVQEESTGVYQAVGVGTKERWAAEELPAGL